MSRHAVESTRSQPSSRLTIQDGMQLCRARDVYKAEGWWRTLCVVFFGVLFVYHLTAHHWVLAVEIGVAWVLVQWGVPRLLHLIVVEIRDGVRWTGRKLCDLGRKQWQQYQAAHRGQA